MAITATLLTAAADNVDATTKATASITTNASRLTLAWIINTKTTLPELPTITDANRTWVQVATITYASIATPLRRLTCFRCMTGATGALTFTFGGATQTGFIYSVDEYAGVDVGGTDGSAAIVQAVTNRADGATGLTVTLAAFGNAANATVGGVGKAVTQVLTAGSGFTELSTNQHGTPNSRGQVQFRTDNDTSVDWSWVTAADCGGIALELAAAASTFLAAPPAILSWVVPTALVVAGALSVAAPTATASWSVPVATVTGALSLAASPATSMWEVPPATTTTGALALAASPAITTWTVPSGAVVPGAVALDAPPAVMSLVVPTATVTGSLSIPAAAAVSTWTIPIAGLTGPLSISAPVATTTWLVPTAALAPGALHVAALPAASAWVVPTAMATGVLAIAATPPAIVTWVVPTAQLLIVMSTPLTRVGSYETTTARRGSWQVSVTRRGRVG